MRIDQYLVENKFFESRSKAQAAIEEGLVYVNNVQIKKPSYEVLDTQPLKIEIKQGLINRYVSRGGVKLKGALERVQLNPKNKVVLDVGVSTGGFSDCVLQMGASLVVGIDVGHGQIHEKIKKIPHFHVFEGTHVKHLSEIFFSKNNLPTSYDLIVVDVSFISLTKVVEFLAPFLARDGKLLCLVKPQFELESKHLNKKGIVKEQSLYAKLEENIRSYFKDQSLKVEDYFESPIHGGDGNTEFFIYASHS